MPVTKNNTLVLLSGGIDSTAALDFFIRQGHETVALFVDYGQLSAANERNASMQVSHFYNIHLKSVEVNGFPKFADGYLKGRNGFLLLAALMAFGDPAGIISLGIHSSTSYADCSQLFANKIQEVFDIYANGAIKIYAPFVTWKKAEVWQYCIDNDVPIRLTYSCELGMKQPCGKCLSCKDLEVLDAR